MAGKLTFEPQGHVYRLDGRVLPSVTQVLQLLEDFEGVPPAVLEAARVFGTHVHDACALDVRGLLDWATLDVALVPYVEAFRRFLRDTGFKVLVSERRVVHPTMRYAGTLDLYGILRTRHALIDIKSGMLPRTVGPQVAAYEKGLLLELPERMQRYCLQLNPEFPCGYKLHALTDAADWQVFVSALNCWHFRSKAA